MTAIKSTNLKYSYTSGIDALNGITLEIGKGEGVAILGPNGAGKSTFALHLNALLMPSSGSIEILGKTVSRKNISAVRQQVGLVFQNPEDQLFCPTVEEDIAFGPKNLGLKGDELRQRVGEIIAKMGLSEIANRNVYHLSLGQKKRAAIGCVLAMAPKIIVLDEPLAFLDPAGQKSIVEIIKKMKATKILVTHNPDAAAILCERTVLLNRGKIVADGKSSELLSDENLLAENNLGFRLSRQTIFS